MEDMLQKLEIEMEGLISDAFSEVSLIEPLSELIWRDLSVENKY